MKYVERQRTTAEYLIVKATNIEISSQLFAGFFSQPYNLELAELVSESLTGPGNVSVNFGLDVGLIHSGVSFRLFHVNQRMRSFWS